MTEPTTPKRATIALTDASSDPLYPSYQISISAMTGPVSGYGYRLMGPKYNGQSRGLRTVELDQRDADEIRAILDDVFPPVASAPVAAPTTAPPVYAPCTVHGADCRTEDWPAPPAPPVDTDLRDRIAQALAADDGHPWDTLSADAQQGYRRNADAVLAVLPASTDQAAALSAELTRRAPMLGEYANEIIRLRAEVERLRADRATVLREAAELADRLASEMRNGEADWPEEWSSREVRDAVTSVGKKLRRLADEAQQPETEARGELPVVAYRDPRNPRVLLCRICGERWAGVDPVTAEDLPDGGICTFGRLSSHPCGRDVLATPAPSEEPK
ncbi:hypothetical protein ABZ456_29190 [Streptomyces sp. NPDC005776]|uniref:hypothetical protein n=1 Tax=Streptomyces sp. NPDC005776 TaxID=3154676 RepID=UPI00340951FB